MKKNVYSEYIARAPTGDTMREVEVVYRADILLLGWLLLYCLHTEVSGNTTTITHVTLIALSHHYSITVGCNTVQWHSVMG